MKQSITIYAIFIILITLLVLFSDLSFSQEAQPLDQETTEEQITEFETKWLWGEVVSVDANSGQLLLKCIDYEIDAEKEITVYTSAETSFENVSGLAQIRPEDTVSIDYILTDNDKIVAEHITIEELEALPDAALPSSESGMSDESEVPKL